MVYFHIIVLRSCVSKKQFNCKPFVLYLNVILAFNDPFLLFITWLMNQYLYLKSSKGIIICILFYSYIHVLGGNLLLLIAPCANLN